MGVDGKERFKHVEGPGWRQIDNSLKPRAHETGMLIVTDRLTGEEFLTNELHEKRFKLKQQQPDGTETEQEGVVHFAKYVQPL